jgi:hypothetical protein
MISKILYIIRRERLIWANWKARNDRPQTQQAQPAQRKEAKVTWQDSLAELS